MKDNISKAKPNALVNSLLDISQGMTIRICSSHEKELIAAGLTAQL